MDFFQISLFELFQQKNLILSFALFSFLMIKLRMSPHHSKSGTHLKSPSKMQVRLDTWFMLEILFSKTWCNDFPQAKLSNICLVTVLSRPVKSFPLYPSVQHPEPTLDITVDVTLPFSALHDNVFWKFVVSIPIKKSYVLSCGHNTTQLPSHYTTNGWATKYRVGTQAFPTPPVQGTTWPCVI